jgi:hypothetical protein
LHPCYPFLSPSGDLSNTYQFICVYRCPSNRHGEKTFLTSAGLINHLVKCCTADLSKLAVPLKNKVEKEAEDRLKAGVMPSYLIPQGNFFIAQIEAGLHIYGINTGKMELHPGRIITSWDGSCNTKFHLDRLGKAFRLKDPRLVASVILDSDISMFPLVTVKRDAPDATGKTIHSHASLLLIVKCLDKYGRLYRRIVHWCPSGGTVKFYDPWFEGFREALEADQLEMDPLDRGDELLKIFKKEVLNMNNERFQDMKPVHGEKNPLDEGCGIMVFYMMRMILENVEMVDRTKPLWIFKFLDKVQKQFKEKVEKIMKDKNPLSTTFKHELLVKGAGFRYNQKKTSFPLPKMV